MPTREAIQAQARLYIDTPFIHQGRLRGRGLDCVGLVLSVAEDLRINDKSGVPILLDDYRQYGPQPEGTLVLDCCRDRLIEKQIKDLKPGDVICTRIPDTPTHTAIIVERNNTLYMVHAYQGGAQKCVEHIMDFKWRRRIVAAFEFPGVEG